MAHGRPVERTVELRSTSPRARAGEQAESLDPATIRVEDINGPVLLLSGESDTLWPSADLSRAVVERLRAHGFEHAV